jgi:hypothetical protein
MGNARATICATVWGLLFVGAAPAQSVISAHSGVIHYVEGEVTIDGTAVHPKFAEFPDVKSGQVLATEEGRVEVLLTPGVFLRLTENSSVRMISNALANTRLDLVSGSALIEVAELLEHNAIAFDAVGAHITLAKKGLYRIDVSASPARLRVFDGQAVVSVGAASVVAHKGHQVDLDAAKLVDARFDVKDTDPFYRWSSRRADYVAAANVISARVASNSDYSSGFASGPSGWSWNPYFGMYTFLPANGVYFSPFGAAFYSPAAVNYVYFPQRTAWFGNPSSGTPASLGTMARPATATPAAGTLGTAPAGSSRISSPPLTISRSPAHIGK